MTQIDRKIFDPAYSRPGFNGYAAGGFVLLAARPGVIGRGESAGTEVWFHSFASSGQLRGRRDWAVGAPLVT